MSYRIVQLPEFSSTGSLYTKSMKNNRIFRLSYNEKSANKNSNQTILKKDVYLHNLLLKPLSPDFHKKSRNRNSFIPNQVILSITKKEKSKFEKNKKLYQKLYTIKKLSMNSTNTKTEPCLFHNSLLKSSFEVYSKNAICAKVDKSTSTMSYSKTLDTQHASYSTKHHLKKVL